MAFGAALQEAIAAGDYANDDKLILSFLEPMEHLIPLDQEGQEHVGMLLKRAYRRIDMLVNDGKARLALFRDVRCADNEIHTRRFVRLNPDFMHKFLQVHASDPSGAASPTQR